MVKLYNPWGDNHPGAADEAGDGGWITFEQYQKLLTGQSTGASLTDGSLELRRILEQGRRPGFLRG